MAGRPASNEGTRRGRCMFVSLASMLRRLRPHWNDVKGNAKWDFIKGISRAISPYMLAALSGFVAFVREAPLWEVLLVIVGALVLAWIVFALWRFLLGKEVGPLEIIGEPCDIPINRWQDCRVIILNRDSKTARDIKVEVTDLTESLNYKKIPLPMVLPPVVKGQNSINPDDKMLFRLFSVSCAERHIEGAPCYVMWAKVESYDNTANAIWNPFSLDSAYRIKIKVTGLDLLSTETDFFINFASGPQAARFTLAPIT